MKTRLDAQAVVQEKYREFSIYGERVRIPVERRNVDKSKNIYFATKRSLEITRRVKDHCVWQGCGPSFLITLRRVASVL